MQLRALLLLFGEGVTTRRGEAAGSVARGNYFSRGYLEELELGLLACNLEL